METMTPIFEALVEPNRRRILDLLCTGHRPVGEIAETLGLSQPAASKHLRVLKEAGLVAVRPDAQRRLYELRPEPLSEIDAWLMPYRQMWQQRLDALERLLDTMPDVPPELDHSGAHPEPIQGGTQ
jgi:DNA-binding transcriptional ArsR family regulator